MATRRETAKKASTRLIGGMSLRQVATRMDMSAEGVRQLVDAYPDLAKKVADARAERSQARRTKRDSDQADARVRRRGEPRESSRTYSDADLAVLFRRFQTERPGPASSYAFIAWLKENEGPSARTFLDRFGPTWAGLCERFGVTPASATRRGRTVTDAECLRAVRRVAKLVGGPPTAEQYQDMKTPGEPARKTIATRLGGGRWSGVTAMLLARAAA